jgi:hypothetical protein
MSTLQRWVRKTVNAMAEIVKQKTKKLAKGQQQDGPTDVAGIKLLQKELHVIMEQGI